MDVIQRNNVTVTGSQGPVLLYAHGFGCSQAMWSRVAAGMPAHYRQVMFDYVGSGRSDLSAFDVRRYATLGGYAQDLVEVCDALGLRSGVTLVAHSVSCSIGWLAAIARPGLFSGQVLLGPNPCFLNHPPGYLGGFDRAELDDLLALMDQNYLGWAHTLAPVVAGPDGNGAPATELTDSFCSTDPTMARLFAQATFFADNRADLQKVACPSLVLQHRDDALAPLAVGEHVRAHLRDARLQVLDVAGHCAHLSHPALVIDALKAWLATQPPGP